MNKYKYNNELTLSSTVTAVFFLPTTNSSPESLVVESSLFSAAEEVARQACSESLDREGGALGEPVTLSMRRNIVIDREMILLLFGCDALH